MLPQGAAARWLNVGLVFLRAQEDEANRSSDPAQTSSARQFPTTAELVGGPPAPTTPTAAGDSRHRHQQSPQPAAVTLKIPYHLALGRPIVAGFSAFHESWMNEGPKKLRSAGWHAAPPLAGSQVADAVPPRPQRGHRRAGRCCCP